MTTTKKIVTKKLTMAALLPPLLLLLAGCAGVGEAAPLGQDELFVPVGQYVAVRPDTPTSETGTLLMAGETAFPSGPASNNPVPGDTVAISTTHCAQNRFFWKLPGGCCALIPKRVFGKVRTSAGRSSQSDDPATDLIRRQEQSRRPALQPQPVNVRGRVVDGISGNPIPGAQVFVRPATAGASGPVGPITTDAKGEFRATVIGGPNLNYTVSAAADGYLGATGSPFPTYGPGVTDLATGRPGLPVGLLLENGGVDVALVKAADLGAGNNQLVAVLTWNRYAKFQDLRFVGQWTNYATQSRGVVRQPGGPFYQIVADRTAPDVPGRPAVFATDRFFNQRELADDTISDSYAVLAGQAFFFTKTGFLGSARPPFDVNSGWNLFIIDAGSYVTYPIWHPASYSSASDRLTLIPTEASMYPEPSLQSMEDVL